MWYWWVLTDRSIVVFKSFSRLLSTLFCSDLIFSKGLLLFLWALLMGSTHSQSIIGSDLNGFCHKLRWAATFVGRTLFLLTPLQRHNDRVGRPSSVFQCDANSLPRVITIPAWRPSTRSRLEECVQPVDVRRRPREEAALATSAASRNICCKCFRSQVL